MSEVKYPDHGWRYGSRQYPAPDGIQVRLDLVGGKQTKIDHQGRIFYVFNEGYFCVVDPANGGYPVSFIERGLVRRVEIEAL